MAALGTLNFIRRTQSGAAFRKIGEQDLPRIAARAGEEYVPFARNESTHGTSRSGKFFITQLPLTRQQIFTVEAMSCVPTPTRFARASGTVTNSTGLGTTSLFIGDAFANDLTKNFCRIPNCICRKQYGSHVGFAKIAPLLPLRDIVGCRQSLQHAVQSRFDPRRKAIWWPEVFAGSRRVTT